MARRSKSIGRYNGGVKTAAETDKRRWERETLDPALAKGGERASSFTTISGRPIDRLYTPEEIRDIDPARDIEVAAVDGLLLTVRPIAVE